MLKFELFVIKFVKILFYLVVYIVFLLERILIFIFLVIVVLGNFCKIVIFLFWKVYKFVIMVLVRIFFLL